MKRPSKCPFRGTCQNPGIIRMWGCVTHQNVVRVCRGHEQIYRDYGWIRARRPRGGREAVSGLLMQHALFISTNLIGDLL